MILDLKTFAPKGCKIAMAKKGFYEFFHLFTPLKRLFAPTFQSQISKLFRLFESMGKFFSHKGCSIAAHKTYFLANFALLAGFFFWYWSYTIHISREILCLQYADFF